MTTKLTAKQNAPTFGPMYEGLVAPGSFLERLLISADNPRKTRWNRYLRACKLIPKSSPVHGTTDWKKINARRGELIGMSMEERPENEGDRWFKTDPECMALQNVCSHATGGGLTVQCFLMGRMLRRLKAKIEQKKPTP